jgi:hypothetical protein
MVSLALDVMPSSSVTSATLRVSDTAPVLYGLRHAWRLHAPGAALPDRTDSESVSASSKVAARGFFGGEASSGRALARRHLSQTLSART